MLALIQRVTSTKVTIDHQVYSQVNRGYVILLGVFQEDSENDVEKLSDKVVKLRIMADEQGKMNRSITDVKGEILVASQFTLCADLSGGRRPSFIKAKPPHEAEKLYQLFIKRLIEQGITVKNGKFGEYMEVEIINDGPVTIIADSKAI